MWWFQNKDENQIFFDFTELIKFVRFEIHLMSTVDVSFDGGKVFSKLDAKCIKT